MTGDQELAELASAMLVMRVRRKSLFPSEIFDEYAWDMLLHLFVAHADNAELSTDRLIALAGAPPETGRRWIAHLADDGQVEMRAGGADVALTGEAVRRLRTFLRDRANIVP